MAIMDVKKLIQEMVVPELKEIKLEQRDILTEVKRLCDKIDFLRSEVKERSVGFALK